MSRRQSRGGFAAIVLIFWYLFCLGLAIAFWVIMIRLALAGIHYLNTH